MSSAILPSALGVAFKIPSAASGQHIQETCKVVCSLQATNRQSQLANAVTHRRTFESFRTPQEPLRLAIFCSSEILSVEAVQVMDAALFLRRTDSRE
eukprot:199592-Pleurochrysis_carterae.AAC.2